jgi:multiple sugar transport system substrate-binding protein
MGPRASKALWTVLPGLALLLGSGCGRGPDDVAVVTFPGSAVGAEAQVLARQLERFMLENPDIRVEQRVTPDAADQRHQLYVQWLNAWAPDPDILQLDVIWAPEFAAAGWLLPLDEALRDDSDFFPATLEANTWQGRLYAVPWFLDVGMLYWRTDLLDAAPTTLAELFDAAAQARASGEVSYGWVWQGARYEGLVTVFLELLASHGGSILEENGEVAVDSAAGVRALRDLRAAIEQGISPRELLTWHEEETRFAFQMGRALFMRNWPYAFALMQDDESSPVAGRFDVAPMPAAEHGRSAATLGGAQLAINARSDVPEEAKRLIQFLTRPEQMIERARLAGNLPPRPSLYRDEALREALPFPVESIEGVVARAVARPATPVYTQLSLILQVSLHRALTGQQEPEAALSDAAREMRRVLARFGLSGAEPPAARAES